MILRFCCFPDQSRPSQFKRNVNEIEFIETVGKDQLGEMDNLTETDMEDMEHSLAVDYIKWVAYSIVAYIIVGVGILGNLASLVVLTRPNLKGVMYVYLLGLAVSNLCVMISAVPALFDISHGLGKLQNIGTQTKHGNEYESA